MAVKRAYLNRSALSIDNGLSVIANTHCVDVGGAGGTNCLTEALFFSVSRLAQTSIGVAVIVLTRIAVGADASDSDVFSFTDAGLCRFRVVFVDTRAGSDVTSLGELVVGLIGSAYAANSVDDVVSLGAVAFS